MSNKKIFIIRLLAGLLVVTGLIVGAYFIINRGHGHLEITITPNDASYRINGKDYTGSQNMELKTGKYTIGFHRGFFDDKTESVEIKRDSTAKLNVLMGVSGKTDSLIGSLSDTDQQAIDTAEQLQAEVNKNILTDKNPILSVLPLVTDDYRIDFGFYDNSEKPTIEITIFTEALSVRSEVEIKDTALKSIENYKIDTSKIVWYKDSVKSFE